MRTAEVLTDVSVLERSDIDVAGHSSLEEILASQPGVEMTTNGSQGAASSLMIRGTNGSHVLLLVDGVRIGSATSGNIAWSRIPASQIERIEIIRGPASSLYGSEAIGGVIQIFTRQGNGPLRFTAEAGAGSYGTRSTNAGLAGGHDGWRYALNLSQYTTDGFDSKPEDTKANRDKDGFRNDSTSGRLAYEFARGHELAFGFLYSEGRNQYDSSGIAVDWVNRTRNGAANLTLKNALTSHWNSTLSVGHSIDKSKALKDGVRNSVFDTEQRQYAWQNDIRSNFGNFLLGFERLKQEVDTTSRYALFERNNNSLLAGWNHGFAKHRLQASVRRDDNSQFGNKTTGTAAYGYRFTQDWRPISVSVLHSRHRPSTTCTGENRLVGNPATCNRNRRATAKHRCITKLAQHHVSLTWYVNGIRT
jgi:vitamin B12 transporter